MGPVGDFLDKITFRKKNDKKHTTKTSKAGLKPVSRSLCFTSWDVQQSKRSSVAKGPVSVSTHVACELQNEVHI